ncbi:MAG TPA: MoxR family ATPase, partial [Candidatus Nitrosotenuis sp.]|nr:MoxR family ATPase [Candidatus Nitrosotenuis sp.]
KVIVGQQDLIRQVLLALVAGGHVLLEGVPGLGKTLLVKTLARCLDLSFSRIQFTPDLMPADISGTNLIEEQPDGRRAFRFHPGPLFAHLVLADEINRATPKTQSALLEAMQEGSVTVAGVLHRLAEPFFVMATQNPLEMEGTYPLPEAQVDRFLFKLNVAFPDLSELTGILERTTGVQPPDVRPVCDGPTLLEMRRTSREVVVAGPVLHYAARLVMASHPGHPQAPAEVRRYVRYGASPRGAQALLLAGKVRALMEGRFNVAFEDIQAVAPASLRHRLILSFEGETEGISPDRLVAQLIAEVPLEPR